MVLRSTAPKPSSAALSYTNTTAPTSASHLGEEADKFQVFERWLRINGAQFPLLELRKYDSPSSKTNYDEGDEDDDGRGLSGFSDNEAEEKKDAIDGHPGMAGGGGGNGSVSSESEGVAMMSLHGTNKNSHQENEDDNDDDDGSNEMRGVHAKTSIPPQTVCVSIPKSCLITVEMGQSTPIGRKILNSDLELDAPKHIFLMIYLLWDKKVHGPKSFFKPYYDILPRSLRNMPIFWTEEELAYLEGSHLLVQIADRAEAIKEDYVAICNLAPEFSKVASLEEFRWARMIVCSRNFGLLVNGHRTSALVPHADMLNHFRPRETKWTFCEETQCFTITTLQTIGRGAQVYDSYGQKCNHRFLLNYGFCVERNVEIDGFCPNEVPLEVGLDLALMFHNNDYDGDNENGDDSIGNSKNVGEGRRNDGNGNSWASCWEKKLAFWARGDNNSGSASMAAAVAAMASAASVAGNGTQYDLYGASSGIAGSVGSSFQALAAAVAGASTSSLSQSGRGTSSSTKDILHNIATMNDAAAANALSQAINNGPIASHPSTLSSLLLPSPSPRSSNIMNSNINSATTNNATTAPTTINCPIKRVRVCVSNNENTRVLFSMLRVLACNSGEIDRIASLGGGRLGNPGSGGSSSSFYGSSSSGSLTAAQRLFGAVPPSSSTTSSSSSLRTCRDIRHPINLRNERRAMELLLTITARALSKYPTSLTQDNADLEGPDNERNFPKYSNRRNAKLQVRGEKEVLHHFALWARTGMHVIDIILSELEMERRRLALLSVGSSAKDDQRSNTTHNNNGELGYEYVIQAMEEDDDCHMTILRYCSDVLGAVRRDELNRIAAAAAAVGATSAVGSVVGGGRSLSNA